MSFSPICFSSFTIRALELSDVAGRPLNRDLIRALAVIKLWESDRNNLDYGQFTEQIKSGGDYDLRELTKSSA